MLSLSFEPHRAWDDSGPTAHELALGRLIQKRRDLLSAAAQCLGLEPPQALGIDLALAEQASTSMMPRELLSQESILLDRFETTLFEMALQRADGRVLLEDGFWREGNRSLQAQLGPGAAGRLAEISTSHRSGPGGLLASWDALSSWAQGIPVTDSRDGLANLALRWLESEAPFRSNPRHPLWVELWKSPFCVEGLWLLEAPAGAVALSCWIQWIRGALHAIDPKLRWVNRSGGLKFRLSLVS